MHSVAVMTMPIAARRRPRRESPGLRRGLAVAVSRRRWRYQLPGERIFVRQLNSLDRVRPQPQGKQAAAGNIGRYRWRICSLLFLATTINYMDRSVLGVLASYRYVGRSRCSVLADSRCRVLGRSR